MGKKRVPKSATFRVAIASDLHVHDEEGDDSPSHLRVGAEEGNPAKHPIAGLHSIIADNGLTADLLLCPGDLGDKASRKGIQYAWKMLNDLKAALGAKQLLGTVGNHDVDCKGKETEFDPRGYLQSLSPLFPIDSEADYDRYWSRHFALTETSNSRVIMLNSSAFHGYKDEHSHGRVSDFTLSQLKAALQASQPKPINILMCHHHPLQHAELTLGEHDIMHGGQGLLDLLGDGSFGEWLVIHGHKHHPKISYAAGSTNSPTVFAAGSLCANLFKNVQASARNQFYILEFDVADVKAMGLVGTFRAWDWIIETGWQKASPSSGLPAHGAFGARAKPSQLAIQIDSSMSEPLIKWADAVGICPDLKYATPADLKSFFRCLKDDHNVSLLKNEHDEPRHLERTV